MRQSVSQSVPSVGSGGRQDQNRRHSSPVVSSEKSASSHSHGSSSVSSQSGQLCGVWLDSEPGGPRVFYTTGRERGKTELFPAGETKIFQSDHAQSRDPLTASSSLICTSTAVLLSLQLPGYFGSFLEIDIYLERDDMTALEFWSVGNLFSILPSYR